ncbi:MAG: hypothetical protein H0W65_05090 [Sphingomonas sp.]|uniref:hypothetical protein n=1 Tax=Sphingomonas sp. TaxID=28214 RepID=UPI0017FAED2C|nr:hypothetical protein [Sphingomonas sp.]MBA3667079.1 hypothetical protein [Sphingomonas sp.]
MKGLILSKFVSAVLAITMLAAALLLIFGLRALRTDRKRGLLMTACGLVFVINVLIWTV